MASTYRLTIGGKTRAVEVSQAEAGLVVRIDGAALNADLHAINGSLHTLLLNGESYEVVAVERQYGYEVLIDNQVFDVEVERADLPPSIAIKASASAASGPAQLRTPLTGKIVDVKVGVGDAVVTGQVLVVVESMKMNNELRAPRSGDVATVLVQNGDRVERNAVLLTIA